MYTHNYLKKNYFFSLLYIRMNEKSINVDNEKYQEKRPLQQKQKNI